MSGSTEGQAEGATEVACTKSQQPRQILNANPSAEMRLDVCRQPPPLPGGEAAARDLARLALKRQELCRYRAGLPAEQRDRARDVSFGGLAVTITSKACGFHELCGCL